MGHSNTSAPDVSQKIAFGDKALELTYASITWAGGKWNVALSNEATRDGMRTRVNRAAAEKPLGSMSSAMDLSIGGASVAAGEYQLAFVIGDDFQWQLSLSNEQATHVIDLALSESEVKLDRLVLCMYPMSDKGDAAIWIGFGDEAVTLPLSVSAPKTSEAAATATINTVCPLMDEAVDPAYVVTYEGARVGLCCEGCVPDWNALVDTEKQKFVARWKK